VVVDNDRFRLTPGPFQPVEVLMVVERIAAGPVDQSCVGITPLGPVVTIAPAGREQHVGDPGDGDEIIDRVLALRKGRPGQGADSAPTLLVENEPLAAWAAKDLGVKNVAIVADTSDYGTGNAKAFETYFTQNGGAITSTDLLPVGTTDFRAVLTKIKGSGADAIYFGGVITEAGILRKQQKEIGLEIPMIGISGFYDPEFISLAGDAAEGTMVSYPAAQSNPKLEQMHGDYAAHGFADPESPYTKYAYDATGILLAAIREVGIDDKAALAKAIRGISYDGVLGVTTFDANGQTQIPMEVEIKIVKDGKWVTREG
jgi:branched-chain amino acid transport system substrate-binding protein